MNSFLPEPNFVSFVYCICWLHFPFCLFKYNWQLIKFVNSVSYFCQNDCCLRWSSRAQFIEMLIIDFLFGYNIGNIKRSKETNYWMFFLLICVTINF